MEWLEQGSLLQPESWGVLNFSQTPSVVFKGIQKHNVRIELFHSLWMLNFKLGSLKLILRSGHHHVLVKALDIRQGLGPLAR